VPRCGQLEALGYLERVPDPGDARVRRILLTARGRDAIGASREIRASLNARFVEALGADRVHAAAAVLADAVEVSGGLDAVRGRRVPPAQGLSSGGR
jgi:DNA-binding MarR family transcriptional regulator